MKRQPPPRATITRRRQPATSTAMAASSVAGKRRNVHRHARAVSEVCGVYIISFLSVLTLSNPFGALFSVRVACQESPRAMKTTPQVTAAPKKKQNTTPRWWENGSPVHAHARRCASCFAATSNERRHGSRFRETRTQARPRPTGDSLMEEGLTPSRCGRA